MNHSLRYYWRIHIAVILGTAIGAAVLTGALLTGDSVRGSLRNLVLDRLGEVDVVLLSNRFQPVSLVDRLKENEQFQRAFESAVPAIVLRGGVTAAEKGVRASRVNIYGVSKDFFRLFPGKAPLDFRITSSGFPAVAINEALQKELGIGPEDDLLLSLRSQQEIHSETLLGRRDRSEVVERMRVTVASVIPNTGYGNFQLEAGQQDARNIFVEREALEKALSVQNQTNAILLKTRASATVEAAKEIRQIVAKIVTPENYGLKILERESYFVIQSKESILNDKIADAIARTTQQVFPVFTYLASKISIGDRVIAYSTVSGISRFPKPPFEPIPVEGSMQTEGIGNQEILLNRWAAERLKANVGDSVELTYYLLRDGTKLETAVARFNLKGIVEMSGLAVSRDLTPDYPGISDAEDMSDWSPPFPLDLKLITPDDETYWDEYRAAPKAFISLTSARKLWSSRFGGTTTIHVPGDYKKFEAVLLKNLNVELTGINALPLKQQGLQAASGSTDFGMLFLGFSFFLILSALFLVSLLYKLATEQRAFEIGLLKAVGFDRRAVTVRFLKEGLILAGIGSITGVVLSIAYCAALIAALRSWWFPAVGTTRLSVYWTPGTLFTGLLVAFLLCGFTIWTAVRRLSKLPAPLLLSASAEISSPRLNSKQPLLLAIFLLLAAAGLLVASFLTSERAAAPLFFGSGACLLSSILLMLFVYWKRSGFSNNELSLVRMAAQNGARNPGRSLLSAGMIACACFVLFAVGAQRKEYHVEGAGRFELMAESEVPLTFDLNQAEVLAELKNSNVLQIRRLSGDDSSCLNLYKPQRPTILGVPAGSMKGAGFPFRQTVDQRTDPWKLLESHVEPGVVPAIGDYDSVIWILKLGLNQDVEVENEFGDRIRLRFVGLLDDSVFQSEILISEENLLRHFPSVEGYSYFLIDTPPDEANSIGAALENELSDFGFDALASTEKLASFQSVENTYLSTFQVLGGLGLLLGTLGLAAVLIRNVLERRKELATFRAFGFRASTLKWLVLGENFFLMLAGIAAGTVSALVAVFPNMFLQHSSIPWAGLLLLLLLVLVLGSLSNWIAASYALRQPLLPSLKSE